MEEKIYFKPANYGKGKRKQEQTEPKKKKDRKILKFVGIFLLLVIIVAIIIWFLHGKTTTTGQFPANIRSESLSCVSHDITYEKTNEADSDDKELKIDMIFTDSNTFGVANLKYTLRYATNNEAYVAETNSHAQFNIGLQSLGYAPEKFNNKFTRIDNTVVITLSITSAGELNEITKNYFLINSTDSGSLPSTIIEYRQNYERQGFSCASTLDNKQ